MFADTPAPPYTAVIFTALRTGDDEAGYGEAVVRMGALAARQPGYLGIETVEDPRTGAEITVSYWGSDADAHAWKRVAEHAEAQRAGRERWYERYEIRVATVERAYGGVAP